MTARAAAIAAALVAGAGGVARADGSWTGEVGAAVEGELGARSDTPRTAARVLAAATSDLAFTTSADAAEPGHLIVAGAGSAEARTGEDAPVSATAEGSIFVGTVPVRRDRDQVVGMAFPTRLGARLDLERLPGIDARRDLRRAAYTRREVDVDLDFGVASSGRTRVDFVHLALATARTAQQDGGVAYERREETIGVTFFGACRLRWRPAPDLCVSALGFRADMVMGGSDATLITAQILDVAGLRLPGELFVDAGVAIASAGPGETSGSTLGGPVRFEEYDLPSITAPAGYVRVAREVGRAQLDARAARDLYVSIDGDLAEEDSVRGELRWTAGASTYVARGFASRTRWWTAVDDPGRTEVTGGGELGLIRRERAVEIEAAVGVARSYYDVLAGGAADLAGLAGTARLVVRRGVARTW